MARDEALLRCVGRGESPPTLRFYRWSPPTISLGYFQRYADLAALGSAAAGLPVVRRQTGGGAILHDQELTYSLTLPLDHLLIGKEGPNALYDHVHAVFASLLVGYGVPVTRGLRRPAVGRNRRHAQPADTAKRLSEKQETAPLPQGAGGCSHHGPFFCFERHSRFDLLADGKKLMGSAQRRTRAAVLQHGSLIIDCRFDQQICATVRAYTNLDIEAHLPELARAIARGPVCGPGTPGNRGLGVSRAFVSANRLGPPELGLAEQLRHKYAGDAWTRRR